MMANPVRRNQGLRIAIVALTILVVLSAAFTTVVSLRDSAAHSFDCIDVGVGQSQACDVARQGSANGSPLQDPVVKVSAAAALGFGITAGSLDALRRRKRHSPT
jgi:hypothetical protein